MNSHRVFLSTLVCFAVKLNSELDKGSVLSMDDASKAIKSGVPVQIIRERFGAESLSTICAADEVTISETFQRYGQNVGPDDFHVQHNGLSWLLALTLEMIQHEEWLPYVSP